MRNSNVLVVSVQARVTPKWLTRYFWTHLIPDYGKTSAAFVSIPAVWASRLQFCKTSKTFFLLKRIKKLLNPKKKVQA